MDSNNMAVYMRNRRQARRSELIRISGGCCIICGSVEKLEFDHRDRQTKKFLLSGKGLDGSWELILQELEKCDLLCFSHHREKTVLHGETGGGHNKIYENEPPHGTGQKYYKPFNCRCGMCRTWRKQYRLGIIGFSDSIVEGFESNRGRSEYHDEQNKECTKCKIVKSLKDFSPNLGMKDGKHSQCKLCRAEATRLGRKKQVNILG